MMISCSQIYETQHFENQLKLFCKNMDTLTMCIVFLKKIKERKLKPFVILLWKPNLLGIKKNWYLPSTSLVSTFE